MARGDFKLSGDTGVRDESCCHEHRAAEMPDELGGDEPRGLSALANRHVETKLPAPSIHER